MACNKDNKDLITNADTLLRREWIASAIESVRARLDEPLPAAESGNLVAFEEPADAGSHLTLVWSADERRSGT